MIVVQVTPALAGPLRGEAPSTSDSAAVERIVANERARLHALHPDSSDSELRTWFALDLPEDADPSRLLAGLRARHDITAAYVKPPDALPG